MAVRFVKVESNPSAGLISNGILSFRCWKGLAVSAQQQTYVRQAIALTSRCSLHMGSVPSRINAARSHTPLWDIERRSGEKRAWDPDVSPSDRGNVRLDYKGVGRRALGARFGSQ